MKQYLQYLFLIVLFLMKVPTSNAQERKLDKANDSYQDYGYINAREIYKEVAEKGFESEELYQKIADSYYFNAEYKNALKWYEKLFEINKESEPKYVLRYAQSLKANGDDRKANKYYNLFTKKSGDELKDRNLSAKEYLELIAANSNRYKISALREVNTEGIDYGAAQIGQKLVYASTKDEGIFMKRKSGWDGLNFLDLYEVTIENDSVVGQPQELPGDVNTKFHESSPVFTADGKTMYFTRNNSTPKIKKKDQKLKIYRAHLVRGKWTNIEELNINSDLYSTAHPALNADESRLYFASDRPGGFGESDLYMISIGEKGKLGKAENLGATINTSGKETFPFISDHNELYFSSDGHFGLGGLDIFYIQIKPFGYGNLLNIGKPINSYADDFAFGIDFETKKGFFSSNRGDSLYSFIYDDIYVLIEETPIVDLYQAKISGVVTDLDTGEPLANATISLFLEDGSLYATITTDENGYYEIETNYFDSYRIRAEKEKYDSDEKVSKSERVEQEINFQLKRNQLEIIPGMNLATVLNIKNILFDFDKSNIRADARVEMEKLLVVLHKYPKLRIAIGSHTDSRGSDTYNWALSDRRAKSTLDYLVDHGIDPNRLSAKGYGETQLLNNCSNGVPCTSAQHQRNRRSEFIVQ